MLQLRIANILRCFAERMGGPPRSTRGLGDAISQLGGDVSYWSAANTDDLRELAKSGPEIRSFPMTWLHSWFHSSALTRTLRSELHAIDLLHIHGIWSHPHYTAARLGRKTDTPYILAPRGELEPWRVRNSRMKHLKKRAYLASLGSGMLQGAACMHAITPCEETGFRQAGYRGPITIVPNGVDVARFRALPDPSEADLRWPCLKGKRVVLFLSRLKEEKGLDQLIPAWREITRRSSFADAILVLAGPDDRGYGNVVKDLIETNGLADRVLRTGMVRGREKLMLMSRADIYTLPSYSEGFSMSVLENLAASCPVLITPGCNFPEVAEVQAGLCAQPDMESLIPSLQSLLELSPIERSAMGSRGRELVVNHFSWQNLAAKMLTVYRCILDGRDIPRHPQPYDRLADISRPAA